MPRGNARVDGRLCASSIRSACARTAHTRGAGRCTRYCPLRARSTLACCSCLMTEAWTERSPTSWRLVQTPCSRCLAPLDLVIELLVIACMNCSHIICIYTYPVCSIAAAVVRHYGCACAHMHVHICRQLTAHDMMSPRDDASQSRNASTTS